MNKSNDLYVDLERGEGGISVSWAGFWTSKSEHADESESTSPSSTSSETCSACSPRHSPPISEPPDSPTSTSPARRNHMWENLRVHSQSLGILGSSQTGCGVAKRDIQRTENQRIATLLASGDTSKSSASKHLHSPLRGLEIPLNTIVNASGGNGLPAAGQSSVDEDASIGGSVQTWMGNVKPLYNEDAAFLDHEEDLITLRPGREHAWLDVSVEKVLQLCNCRLVEYLFCSKATRTKTDRSGGEVYDTRERFERFTVAIIVAMILALWILPIYLLYHFVDGEQACIGILLIFTLLFSACLSLFTGAYICGRWRF